jgi:hypothetical protein
VLLLFTRMPRLEQYFVPTLPQAAPALSGVAAAVPVTTQ